MEGVIGFFSINLPAISAPRNKIKAVIPAKLVPAKPVPAKAGSGERESIFFYINLHMKENFYVYILYSQEEGPCTA